MQQQASDAYRAFDIPFPGQAGFGYAHMQGKLVDGGFVNGAANPINGTRLANIPENSFSLWSSYRLSRELSFGAGAFYVDQVVGSYRVNPADGLLTEFGVPSYWRFDAMANWQASEKLALRLNLQNLADKVYSTTAYPVHYATPAAHRDGHHRSHRRRSTADGLELRGRS